VSTVADLRRLPNVRLSQVADLAAELGNLLAHLTAQLLDGIEERLVLLVAALLLCLLVVVVAALQTFPRSDQ
jgi:hypothetical protein